MNPKPKIEKIIQTCIACPSQWDMWDAGGIEYYVRYRWSNLSVVKSYKKEPDGSYWDEGIFYKKIPEDDDNNFEGWMTTDELIDHLKEIFDFSDVKERRDQKWDPVLIL